jgi:hypothetical protein
MGGETGDFSKSRGADSGQILSLKSCQGSKEPANQVISKKGNLLLCLEVMMTKLESSFDTLMVLSIERIHKKKI